MHSFHHLLNLYCMRLVEECFPLSSGLFGADYKKSVQSDHLELSKPLHGQFMCEINVIESFNGHSYIKVALTRRLRGSSWQPKNKHWLLI